MCVFMLISLTLIQGHGNIENTKLIVEISLTIKVKLKVTKLAVAVNHGNLIDK